MLVKFSELLLLLLSICWLFREEFELDITYILPNANKGIAISIIYKIIYFIYYNSYCLLVNTI